MSKVEEFSNYRVVIEPETPFLLRQDDPLKQHRRLIAACADIVRKVKRHVDGVDSVRYAYDTNYICSDCGSHWTEDSDTFNGGCCRADIKHDPESQEPAGNP